MAMAFSVTDASIFSRNQPWEIFGTKLMYSSAETSRIIEASVGETLSQEQRLSLQPYLDYCHEELSLLCKGVARETWLSYVLAAQTEDEISSVLEIVRQSVNLTRPEIRQRLSTRFPRATVTGLNHSINLALRLWLMLNFQARDYETLRHQASCIEWDDQTYLRECVEKLFPKARWGVTSSTSRPGPHFTVAFLERVCGINIEWTTSICDHLRLDRHKGSLRIFPFKCHLERLIANKNAPNQSVADFIAAVLTSCLHSLLTCPQIANTNDGSPGDTALPGSVVSILGPRHHRVTQERKANTPRDWTLHVANDVFGTDRFRSLARQTART